MNWASEIVPRQRTNVSPLERPFQEGPIYSTDPPVRLTGGAMLFTDRIKNLSAVCPQLSRVWIKTGDPRMPLKSVWISEPVLRNFAEGDRQLSETELAEFAEDHLVAAA